ncbi:MAG: hypothetical protein K2J06_03885, partial [Muribaculaceae bacterium]|nr:hypothetical protein [Muribaculaceae bacterium]
MERRIQSNILRISLLIFVLFQIFTFNNASAWSTIKFEESSVTTKSSLYDNTQFLGEGPGAVCIDYILEDSTVCSLFKSCGCSEYSIFQTPGYFCIDIYSILSIIWGTDCCLEDQDSFCREKSDMVFTFIHDHHSIYGYVQIINDVDYDIISPLPDIETIINNPTIGNIFDEPFYRWIQYYIKVYKSRGIDNVKLYNLIIAFEREVERRQFLVERNCEFKQIEFKQICELYKFALKYENKRIGLNELMELGQICNKIDAYYSK